MSVPESSDAPDAVDRATFFAIMGAFPTGVTVVTALDNDGEPRGLTSNAISSVSAEPPIMLVCVDKRSNSLPALRHSRKFVVNFLSSGRGDLSNLFASKTAEKFADVAWQPAGNGMPLLHVDSLAHAECSVQQEIDAGDHVVLLGRVTRRAAASASHTTADVFPPHLQHVARSRRFHRTSHRRLNRTSSPLSTTSVSAVSANASNASLRVALVTGANRGLGLAVARGLARLGLHVLLSARRKDDARAAAAPLMQAGLVVTPLELDVTDQKSVSEAARDVEDRFGRLEVLVNNAGADYDKPEEPTSVDLAIAQHAFEVNALGAWRTCQAFLPLMRRGGYGRIVNVSSGSGLFSITRDGSGPAYAVSKAALNMLTLKLAFALQGSGILVNAGCPGWVRTRMGGPTGPRSLEEGADTLIWLATLPDDGPTGGFFYNRTRKVW